MMIITIIDSKTPLPNVHHPTYTPHLKKVVPTFPQYITKHLIPAIFNKLSSQQSCHLFFSPPPCANNCMHLPTNTSPYMQVDQHTNIVLHLTCTHP